MTSRRTFIKVAGAAALGGTVAGCTGDSGGAGTDTTDDGEAGADATTGVDTGTTTGSSGTTTGSGGDAGGASGTVLEDRTADGLAVVDHEFVDDSGSQRVRGEIENTGDATYSYVEAHVDPYDSEETKLGRFKTDSQESIDGLAPGSTWEFTVEFETDGEVARYDVWATGKTDGG